MIGNSGEPQDVGFEEARFQPTTRNSTPEERIGAIEDKLPQVTQLVGSVSQLGMAMQEMQQHMHVLSQQRDFTWLQIERNTRATALDLAIKAAPGGSAENLTALATAFVAWLKGPPEGMPAVLQTGPAGRPADEPPERVN